MLSGFFPGLALALALGDIELQSALNEPFDAEIEIVSATPAELDNLNVQIAPRETFERYGLERPDFLSNFVFSVDRRGNRNLLRVQSRQPVAEPFVTFLVEAQWRRGRLLREYTVLLDPPVFVPTPETVRAPAPAPVVTPRSVRAQPGPATGIVERPPQRSRAPVRTVAAGPVSFGASYGPIRRGETLWNIAERLRTDRSLTTNQVMVAIYRANPGAFLGNINLVREGATLSIPQRSAIEALSQPEAFATAVAHNEAWRSGRPAQVARVSSTSGAPSASVAESPRLKLVEPDLTQAGSDATRGSGTGSANAATRATLARNEAEISRLAGENEQLRADLAEIRRLISVRDSELAAMQRQLGEASVPAPALVPQPTLTTTPGQTGADTAPMTGDSGTSTVAATGSGDVAVAVDPTPAVTADPTAATDGIVVVEPSTTDVTTAVTEPTPPPRTTPPVVTTSVPDEPGLISKTIDGFKAIFSSLWLWIALGVTALALFAAFAIRGRGADEPDALEVLARDADHAGTAVLTPDQTDEVPALGSIDDEVEFFDDSGTFKPVDFSAVQAADGNETADYPFEDTVGATGAIKLDQTDPMAEADFHMAYGLYDQAADLVRKAVAREPDRVDLRMKLLEIFFVWGNQDDFRATALDLRDNMGTKIAGEWDKIVIMGKQICPDDELFAGDAGIGTGADIDLAFDSESAGAPAVDFDTTGSQSALTDLDLGFDDDTGEALNLGFGDDTGGIQIDTVETPADDAVTGESALLSDDDEGLDFDLGLEYADTPEEPVEQTQPEPVDAIRDQIKARLSDTDNEETAEMDLSDLGVDLDLGQGDDSATGAFAGVFDDIDATSEMPAPTAEMTAGGDALDLDIGGMFSDVGAGSEDATSQDLESPDEESLRSADSSPTAGHFSAEIETLHGDALDVDMGAFDTPGLDDTRLIKGDDTGASIDDAFAGVFGDATGPVDPTQSLADDEFSASVFGSSEDETVLTEGLDNDDDSSLTGIFAADGDDGAIDLDIGDAMGDSAGDKTTVKVATADLALPDGDDELGEVGTKLDLARAYMDMGDPDGARGILEEVVAEGNETQQADAREMLASLS